MASLIRDPDELFLSEEEWAGKGIKDRSGKNLEKTDEGEADDSDAMEVEEPEQTWAGVDARLVKERVNGQVGVYEPEGPEELSEVLDYVANVIVKLDHKIRAAELNGTAATPDVTLKDHSACKSETEDAQNGKSEPQPSSTKPTTSTTPTTIAIAPAEDPILRNLRLNLLALAKRAPLDTIARLPKDLVPEHIRHFVPTLSSSG
jgi:bromodomain-containing protein 7/9